MTHLAKTQFLPVLACLLSLATTSGTRADEGHRASYYVDGEIHVNVLGTSEGKPITTGHADFKPSWSKTGDMLVFFRRVRNDPDVGKWKTAICIVNVDGTGFHQLTDGTHTDFNQTWTRDGRNTPIWNRKNPKTGGYRVWGTGPPGLAAVRSHMAPEQFEVGEPIADSLGLVLVPIPAGEFVMGAKFDPRQSHDRTTVPPHPVTISKPYLLSAFEVTRGQFEEVLEERPWEGRPLVRTGSHRAATYVSWEQAAEFCRRLGEREGAVYRLPTEAEWEYACRAGTSSPFGLDEGEELGDRAWFHGNAYVVGNQYPHVAGTRAPNAWALFDVQGNAWEWCSDWYGGYGDAKPRTDPTGPAKGRVRVSRGGGFASQPRELQCATRASFGRVNYRPEFMAGFRVVREIE